MIGVWLHAMLTLVALLVVAPAVAHSGYEAVDRFAFTASPSGPPRPAEGWRLAGPWRAELASTPGRKGTAYGGAAQFAHTLQTLTSGGVKQTFSYDDLQRLTNIHQGPPANKIPLSPSDHSPVTSWWNNLQSWIEGK